MSNQPDALRLAGALERAVVQTDVDDDVILVARWFVDDSAAELRRLHQLALDMQGGIYALQMARLTEQKTAALKRDALLEALKDVVAFTGAHGGAVCTSTRRHQGGGGTEMSKHTPGPWVLENRGYKFIVSKPDDGYITRDVCRMDASTMSAFAQEANARLIAAAPLLYEALQDLCDTLGECGMTEKARAAIAAVEGEKS